MKLQAGRIVSVCTNGSLHTSMKPAFTEGPRLRCLRSAFFLLAFWQWEASLVGCQGSVMSRMSSYICLYFWGPGATCTGLVPRCLSSSQPCQEGSDVHPGIQKLNATILQIDVLGGGAAGELN